MKIIYHPVYGVRVKDLKTAALTNNGTPDLRSRSMYDKIY